MSLDAVRCAGQRCGVKSGENLSYAPPRCASGVEIWPDERATAGFLDASDHAAALALIGR
jgi:hypothetical protein